MIETREQSHVIPQEKSKPKSKPSITEEKEIAPIKRIDYKQFLKENAKTKPETSVTRIQNQIKQLPKFQVQPTRASGGYSRARLWTQVLQKYGARCISANQCSME